MASELRMAFDFQPLMIPLDRILPARKLPANLEQSAKYLRIAASVEELGVIEPLMVYPQTAAAKQYLLLDGHVRLHILRRRSQSEAFCLVSTDDEALTYNQKVNQVQVIQEHFMIMKAIRSGVSEERIAACLNVNVARIKEKRDLLSGICPEAVELLKERAIAAKALGHFKKVRPMRQIEMAELMAAANNYTASYARCLLIATPAEQRLEPDQKSEGAGLTREELAKIEHELETLSRDFKGLEEEHGRDTLQLVVVVGYLKKLMGNAPVVRFLSSRYSELLSEFQKLADDASLDDAA